MPINPVIGQLQNPGDKVTALHNGDPVVAISLSGTFNNAMVIVEAMPFGQSVFIPIADVNVQSGQVQQEVGQTGVGPFTNTGPGGGAILKVDGGGYSQVQVRLLSIGSGAITGVIATLAFPNIGANASLINPPDATSTLERFRIRMGISILLEGLGINLQDLTAADQQAFQ